MVDFFMVSTKSPKRGEVQVYPKFIANGSSKDLMIRGGDFYAIWLENDGRWSTDENDALRLIDRYLDQYRSEKLADSEDRVRVLHMWDVENGMIDRWHKYCQKQCRDSYHMLDEKIIFANDEVRKRDYASKRLPYALEEGSTEAWDTLLSVLYSPEEKRKIEWAIGAIVTGDSKRLQKFLVLYGAAGTGKSTVLNVIQSLFEGYYSVFDAKALGSSSAVFALEAFKSNPLVAIQHDGDLSHIEDNTRLNSLVSHEMMTVNEKYKSTYSNRFKAFLFMGTNKPVKITDAKSGIIRRLIDVSPTGETVPVKEYKRLTKQIDFELGAIAWKCREIYEADKGAYDDYIPVSMMSASNDFYNFVADSYHIFVKQQEVPLKQAWDMYKAYCEEAKVSYPYSQRVFKEELKNYFEEYYDRVSMDGQRLRNVYKGFKTENFGYGDKRQRKIEPVTLTFDKQVSLLDEVLADCPAQYANGEGDPSRKWKNVKTPLKEIDTRQLHYVRPPYNHIVIDFDIKNKDGEKDFQKNLEAASKFPPTYGELSKSGAGIHLHYIYNGDVSELSNVYAKNIEIKVFNGLSALRRQLTWCNDRPIATISSGLPLKEKGEKVIDFDSVQSEKGLRRMIERNLSKEFHANTKPSIDFIKKILDDAYESGLKYDVSDMHNAILDFAMQSSNQAETCVKTVMQMRFKSDDETQLEPEPEKIDDRPLVFFDIEVFPNLLLVNWKIEGEGQKVNRMFNPEPKEVGELFNMKLVGFNCRKYDNHVLYARYIGKSLAQCYEVSKSITADKDEGITPIFFREAYNISYIDVYDFAATKQSLKKWEIELGIHHQELGLPWDKPAPKEKWDVIADYCDNDVTATEAVFNHLKGDYIARQILADVAGMPVNSTTNSLTTRIIFGSERHPQDSFNYRFMGVDQLPFDGDEMFTEFIDGKPVFPGYTYDPLKKDDKSMYRGEPVGEGGYVYAEPGIYENVTLLDIASMHPSSILAENLFGPYTERFREIVEARIAIKHKDFDKARKMLDGKLAKYLDDESKAKDLAQALKIAINSVYGLTAATFDNPFKDPRNVDNIVAKRGALFMVNLKYAVQTRGYTVAHIKTDSIKIPNADKKIIDFVMEYGKKYGYNFEHEATYRKMCLVNDAVYIAQYDTGEWTATGKQFQVPYVFKTLFSKEPIIFSDLCETISVKKGDIYLDMNEELPDVTKEEKELKKLGEKFKDGKLSDVEWDKERLRLEKAIEKGHNYIFVGRVGSFCPILPGKGGGKLYRYQNGKYYRVSGSTGYRWLEAEIVKNLKKESDINEVYYISLAQEAKDAIEEYDSFEKFIGEN